MFFFFLQSFKYVAICKVSCEEENCPSPVSAYLKKYSELFLSNHFLTSEVAALCLIKSEFIMSHRHTV